MDTAKRLFIKKGFHDTSMRDIAAALNISVCNLAYHYKKKEDLIEAILLEDHQHYKKPELLCSLDDLNNLLKRNTTQRASRPYYYRYYNQLAQKDTPHKDNRYTVQTALKEPSALLSGQTVLLSNV